jgi:hypothetical protein
MAKERIAYVTYICDECDKAKTETSWPTEQLGGSPKGWGVLTLRRPHPTLGYAEQRIDLCEACLDDMWDFFEQRKAVPANPARPKGRADGGNGEHGRAKRFS